MMMTVAARLLLNPADNLLKLRDDIALRHWHYTVQTGKGRKMRSSRELAILQGLMV